MGERGKVERRRKEALIREKGVKEEVWENEARSMFSRLHERATYIPPHTNVVAETKSTA